MNLQIQQKLRDLEKRVDQLVPRDDGFAIEPILFTENGIVIVSEKETPKHGSRFRLVINGYLPRPTKIQKSYGRDEEYPEWAYWLNAHVATYTKEKMEKAWDLAEKGTLCTPEIATQYKQMKVPEKITSP